MAAWWPCWISCYRYSSRPTIDADMKPSAMNLVGAVVVTNWNSWPWFIQDGCQGGHFEIGFCNLVCEVQTRKSYRKQWESLHIKQLNYWNSNDEVHALFRSISESNMATWRPCWISCYRYSSRPTIDADTKPSAMNLVGPVVVSNWNSWPWLIQDDCCQGGHFEIGYWNLVCDVQTWNSYKNQW